MAYRNFDNLGRSRNQITADLKFKSNNKVHRIMNKDLFQRVFNLEELCNSFTDKAKTNKIPLGIYYPVRICVNNFNKLERIDDKYYNNKNIIGSEILEYCRGIISDIDSLETSSSGKEPSNGEKLIASMLKNHPSVKYAYIMNKYYNAFLEKIALLTSICTGTSVTGDATTFAKMNIQLDEVIWLYILEQVLKRTEADKKSVQFDINEALRNVIKEMSKIHLSCETEELQDRLGGLSEKSESEYIKGRTKLESEYFDKARELIHKDKDVNDTDEFYDDLKEEYTLFDSTYNSTYRQIFLDYAISSSYKKKLVAIKRLLHCTDIYGRMFMPCLIDDIDEEKKCISKYMNILRKKRYNDLNKFNYDKIKELFLIVKFKNNHYCIDDRIAQLGVECTEFISNIFPNAKEDGLKLIYEFSKFFSSKEAITPISLIQDNIERIQYYLNYCSGYTNFLKYNGYINTINKKYAEYCDELKNDSIYKKVRKDIDSAIAHKWTETMLSDL